MIRSRRRPNYGAYICAVVAATLLLLSVTLLHSRLNTSHSQNAHFRKVNDDVSWLPTTATSIDPQLDEPTTSTITNEDRIDELDIVDEDNDSVQGSNVSVEEEILRGVDSEQGGSELITKGTDSNHGYYYDHVTGVVRRAFDKRSIELWEDYVEFDSLAGGEDDVSKGKSVFGSDDVVVDEGVKEKLAEIVDIEDALLLKTGKSVSPLREGWGDWFDKKGDFLRKDRMFKSNLEALNPLNNPLLQDPDGAGVSGLTRGDRLVKKVLFSELKKVPFVGKKPLGFLEMSRDLKGDLLGAAKKTDSGGSEDVARNAVESSGKGRGGNVDFHSRKIVNVDESLNLYKNGVSNEGGVGTDGKIELSGLKQANSGAQTYSEFSGHLYADGKRWGYFPGLHPQLSFSNFVGSFFRKGKCSVRIFMVWNSPPWMFGVRHRRGLETLFLHHPDACVVVFSETIELDFFNDFVDDGFKVAVAMPDLDELLKDTPTHEFASVWFEWKKTKFYSTHYSELVRLAALYKYGGIYIDSDVLVLRPLSSLDNSVGLEDKPGSSLNGAVMAFRKHSPFILECLAEFYSTYDDTLVRWNGADLLTRVAKRYLDEVPISDKRSELKVLPAFVFFPIGPGNITRCFEAPTTGSEKTRQDALFKSILERSYTFHLWNSLTHALIPEKESLVARLIGHFCIHCSEVL